VNSVWQEPCIFSPSLICFDLCNLEEQVHTLERLGVKVLHVDILDGHFSPSMPLGLDTVRQLRAKTDMEFDCHVMTTRNEFFVDELLDIGVQQIVFHVETEPHADGLLNKIRARGVRAGVALKPATPLDSLDFIIEKCDTVLLMLINPGYASSSSEKQAVYAERKIKQLSDIISGRELGTKIEIDGRVSEENIKKYGESEVGIFVTGSTCIKKSDIEGSVKNLNNIRRSIVGGEL